MFSARDASTGERRWFTATRYIKDGRVKSTHVFGGYGYREWSDAARDAIAGSRVLGRSHWAN